MRQAFALLVVLLLVALLGLWGQYELDPVRFRDHFANVLYEVLGLFVLEGDWTQQTALPLQLQITRLLAPLASITGLLLVLTRGAWVELLNFFVRYRGDHIVVAGLGEMSWQFIRSCRDAENLSVIVVERNPENLYVARARSLGVNVLIGDVLDSSMLRRLNLARARHLVTFTGNDGTNVELAIKARNFVRAALDGADPLAKQLRIHLHITDTRISTQLEGYPKFFDDSRSAAIDFFSVYDLNARIVMSDYPPEQFAEVFGQGQVHIALYHFGRLAEHVLLEAIRICHFANGSKLRFTIFDTGENDEQVRLMLDSANLHDLCKIEHVRITLNAHDINSIPEALLQTVTEHVVCCATDERSLEVALLLRAMLLRKTACNAPILVRMQQSSGLAQLLESNRGMPEIPDGLYPFGMLDETLHYENILSDRLDLCARALHVDYLRRSGEVSETGRRLLPAMRDWEALPEPIRKSNRLQADHLAVKLRAVRCNPVMEPGSEDMRFDPEEANLLAVMEHERWRANKLFDGWRAGPEHTDVAKVNPHAVSWQALSEEQRAVEVDSIVNLPGLLRRELNWGIQREFVIGVTGHRPHRLDHTDPYLIESVTRILGSLKEKHRDKRLMVMSPLAEGADRLVARIAMTRFNMGLIVPLPLPYELYQSDFETEDSLAEFRELVGKAKLYFELPMRFGTLGDLARRGSGQSNKLRDQQYALVGAYLVERCDELIAVYDEKGSAGVGGTGDVVGWRLAGKVPDIYSTRSDFFSRPVLTRPMVLNPDKLPA